jgi:hypothetical protein
LKAKPARRAILCKKMILFGKRINTNNFLMVRFRDEPYLIINLIFAGVILLIFVYSGIFSPDQNNYPVVCIHEKITGEPCFSCGLSHSFSLIVRGRINEAYNWNIYGMRVFLFFLSQLFMRIAFSFFYLKYPGTRNQLIIIDSIGSGLLFLLAFWPFLENLVKSFLNSIN